MKVRTGPGPLDWRDEGPQAARAVVRFGMVSAAPVGHMIVPPSTGPKPITINEANRRKERRERMKFVDPLRRKDPDNGAVHDSISEV